MTIDKFGRSLQASSSSKTRRGPKGEGFKLTPEGDFDISSKRLRNVGNPVDIYDAVNLYYVKYITPKKFDDSYSVHQYRIQDVAHPQSDGDAVNRKYVDSRTPYNDEYWTFSGKRLIDAGNPVEATDVVTKQYLEDYAAKRPYDKVTGAFGDFDFKKRKLTNVGDPSQNNDAVTKQYVDERILPKNKDGDFTANFNRVSQVGWALKDHDVVTKQYLESYAPYRRYDFNTNLYGDYHFENKKLGDVARPSSEGDVVTKVYLEENTIHRDSSGAFIANNGLIKKVGDPIDATDVATKGYVDDKTPSKDVGSWLFSSKRISQVAAPEHDSDAVNFKTLKESALCRDDNIYNAGNSKITNLGAPTLQGDAIPLGYMQKHTIGLREEGDFSASGKRLRDVVWPLLPNDVANKGYVDSLAPARTDDEDYAFGHHLLRNVAKPALPTDATNKEYVDSKTPDNDGGHFQFYNKQLQQVGDPTLPHHAATKGYVDNGIGKLKLDIQGQLKRLTEALLLLRSKPRAVGGSPAEFSESDWKFVFTGVRTQPE